MAGIFQSMLYGMNQARGEQRQRAEDEYVAGERQYQQQRRVVTDQYEDTNWQDSREDRQYEVGVERPLRTEGLRLGVEGQRFDVNRKPVDAAQRDAMHRVNMEGAGISNALSRYSLDRAPVEAAQQDQRFGVEMQGAQQGNVMRALGIGSAQRAAQIEEAQQPGKLDEIRLERERKAAMDELGRVGQRFMLTGQQGKKQDAAQLINQTWAKATGDADGDAGVRVNEQGQYYLEGPDGRPLMMLGDEDKVLEYAFQFLNDPTTFAQSRQATYAARAQAQAGALDSNAPARLKIANAYFQNMQRNPNESDNDAWIRAFHETNQRSEVSPTAAARDFYASTLRALSNSAVTQAQRDQAQQNAAQMTQDYMARFYPGQELPLEDLAQVEMEMAPRQKQNEGPGVMESVRQVASYVPGFGPVAQMLAPQQGQPQPTTAPTQARASSDGYPEGTELEGPDGRIYVVRNGQPVPKQ
jgi:hypothetical protein